MLLPVPHHFIIAGHNVSQMRFQVIEEISALQRGSNSIKLLKKRESFWIHTLKTLTPHGLNRECDFTELKAMTCSCRVLPLMKYAAIYSDNFMLRFNLSVSGMLVPLFERTMVRCAHVCCLYHLLHCRPMTQISTLFNISRICASIIYYI